MGWFQKGDGKHDRVEISGSHKKVEHVKSADTKYGSNSKIVTKTSSSDGQSGHTTVHGNDKTNYHGSHE